MHFYQCYKAIICNTALTIRIHKVIYFILTEELKVLLVIFNFFFDQQSSKDFFDETKFR